MKTAVAVVLGLLVLGAMIVFAFGAEFGSLKWQGYFAPKHAAVDREVFKQTRSFTEGKLQELTKYRLEYLREKDSTAKEAIASTIRHQFADFDANHLTDAELRSFLADIRSGNAPN